MGTGVVRRVVARPVSICESQLLMYHKSMFVKRHIHEVVCGKIMF